MSALDLIKPQIRTASRAALLRHAMAGLLVTCLAMASTAAESAGTAASDMPLTDRMSIVARLYYLITRYYPDWDAVPRSEFEVHYRDYIDAAAQSGDRLGFYMSTLALMSMLRSGHSWVHDDQIMREYGAPIGLKLLYLNSEWVVVSSERRGVSAGDTVMAIDGVPIESLFARLRKYIPSSSERDARTQFFQYSFLFPKRFTASFGSGHDVTINRDEPIQPAVPETPAGRWLVAKTVAYLKIPSMTNEAGEREALRILHEFRSARTLVVDVRGNPGGPPEGEPKRLLAELLGRPYRLWREWSSVQIGGMGSLEDTQLQLSTGERWKQATAEGFQGRLLLLIDRGCASLCENFVMPLKTTKRGTLIGEATAGTFAETIHENLAGGLEVSVAATREDFPDGSRFEGVGIAPDISVPTSVDALKRRADPALQRAIEEATSQ